MARIETRPASLSLQANEAVDLTFSVAPRNAANEVVDLSAIDTTVTMYLYPAGSPAKHVVPFSVVLDSPSGSAAGLTATLTKADMITLVGNAKTLAFSFEIFAEGATDEALVARGNLNIEVGALALADQL